MFSALQAICIRIFKISTVRAIWRVGTTQGTTGVLLRVGIFLRQSFAYSWWVLKYDRLTETDRLAILQHASNLKSKPLISVLLPTYNSPERWLRLAIDSVRNQLYPNWELCIADDASSSPHVARVLKEYADLDSRIHIVIRAENGHISAATNSALALAKGEFVALLDHDDELAPHALYLVAVHVNANPRCDMLYSDEDKMDAGGRRFDPYFKSDWNPALLESQNLISHLGVFRTDLLRQIGGFRLGLEGCQDWDVALRMSECVAPENICHIPFVLYHWRAVAGSTAIGFEQKDYVKDAAIQVVRDHLDRTQRSADVVPNFGSFVQVRLKPLPAKPYISIVRFTRNGEAHSQLPPCDGLETELLICEPRETESLAQSINRSARRAKGSMLCFLQSGLKPSQADWLNELVLHACLPDTGAVGPMHLDTHGNIRHAAIYLSHQKGTSEVFHSYYRGLGSGITGGAGRAALRQNVSALAPGCLVIRTSAFEALGGFDSAQYPHFLFELDLCLRAARHGLGNLWTPHAQLVGNLEPKGHAEAEAGAKTEVAQFRKQWQTILDSDPFHNSNLTLVGSWPTPAFPPRTFTPWASGVEIGKGT